MACPRCHWHCVLLCARSIEPRVRKAILHVRLRGVLRDLILFARFVGLLHCCIIAKLVDFVLYSAETRGLQDTDLCTAPSMASVYLVSIQAAFPAWELSTYAVNRDMKCDSLREVGRQGTVQDAETRIQKYR